MNRPLHGPQNPTRRRPRDRHVRHDRLAREERPRVERQGGHPRHLVRRLPAAHGARQPAPRAQGERADEPDGRRLDGRRLVPQRRVPRAEHAVHLRAGRHARQLARKWWTHAAATTTTCTCRPARPASSDAGAASSRWASGTRSSRIPRYDAFWQEQAMDRCSAAQPLKVPVMLVHSLWDQEDIYGDIAVYKAIKPKDTNNDKVFLVHGSVAPRPGDRGRQLARRDPIREQHVAHVSARDPAAVPRPLPEGRRAEGRHRAGDGVRDRHQRVAAAAVVARGMRERLHGARDAALPAAGIRPRVSRRATAAARAAYDEYVSDPAKPVPYRARPTLPTGYVDALHLAAVARGRPARSVGADGRAHLSRPTCSRRR